MPIARRSAPGAPRARRLLAAGALAAGALAAAACGRGLEPSATPTPAAPPAAAVEPRPAAPDARAFAYGPGSDTFVVERRATIEVMGEAGLAQDTVASRAVVRVALATTRLAGTVDSFAVLGGGRVPAAPVPALPLPFAGTVDGGRVTIDGTGAPAIVCRPDAAALAAVGELYPYVPARPVGARWADTVVAEGCRGGVRLTTVAVHQYRAERHAQDGAPLLRVERTTELSVRGAGRMARTPATAEGRGTGRGTFLLDPAAGRLLEGRTETTLELTVDAAGRVERATQRSETTIRRR